MLLREYATKRWFVIPPLLTNVYALPEETWTPEILSIQSCWPTTQQAFRSGVTLLCIAWRTVAIILQVDWRHHTEHFHPRRRRSRQRVPKAVLLPRHSIEHDWKRHSFGIRVSPGSAETLVRRLFDSTLSQQHLLQILLKSVDVRWCYSVQHQCCFFETVYTGPIFVIRNGFTNSNLL